ncbi:MAG: sulfur carrier protein ThiS [Planctomycetaceae bacterium]|nr:sulfur carrier protein ThiS [Planctomycetaceae bacterium]
MITLNGEVRAMPTGATVSDLLAELELDPRYLAVEVNRQVIPRGRHAATELCSDDCVEIVTLVGGG